MDMDQQRNEVQPGRSASAGELLNTRRHRLRASRLESAWILRGKSNNPPLSNHSAKPNSEIVSTAELIQLMRSETSCSDRCRLIRHLNSLPAGLKRPVDSAFPQSDFTTLSVTSEQRGQSWNSSVFPEMALINSINWILVRIKLHSNSRTDPFASHPRSKSPYSSGLRSLIRSLRGVTDLSRAALSIKNNN